MENAQYGNCMIGEKETGKELEVIKERIRK